MTKSAPRRKRPASQEARRGRAKPSWLGRDRHGTAAAAAGAESQGVRGTLPARSGLESRRHGRVAWTSSPTVQCMPLCSTAGSMDPPDRPQEAIRGLRETIVSRHLAHASARLGHFVHALFRQWWLILLQRACGDVQDCLCARMPWRLG